MHKIEKPSIDVVVPQLRSSIRRHLSNSSGDLDMSMSLQERQN